MSYIDIPLSNTNVYLELIDNHTGLPVVNPQFPIGIGRNFGSLYDLGCGIKIHQILSIYELCFSEVSSVTLCLYGTSSVGDMDVYITGDDTISDSPITPNTFDYVIPLEDTYDSTYCGYLFKMSTPNANNYSTFTNTGSYIRIEYNALESIYISNVPKRRYFNTEQLDLTNLVIKAVLSNNTEEVITNYTPSIANGTDLSPSNTSVTFSYTRKLRTRTCTLQIEVVLWGSESLDVAYAGANSDPNQVFDIYIPSGSPPQNGFPTIVTIHGGVFSGGQKEDYNYITSIIINKNCVHVNMNYRLSPEVEINDPNCLGNTHSYYQDMLNDINSLISYLYNNASTYYIDISKIALMGYSAGGNLALGYGLKYYVCQDTSNSNNNIPFKAIITEGAVTFSEIVEYNNEIKFKDEIQGGQDDQCYVPNLPAFSNARLEILQTFKYLLGNTLNLSDLKPISQNRLCANLLVYQGEKYLFAQAESNETECDCTPHGDTVITTEDADLIVPCNNQKRYHIRHDGGYASEMLKLENNQKSQYRIDFESFIDTKIIL